MNENGDHIAFQQFGAGPHLLLLAGWSTHLSGMWREPSLQLFLLRLAAGRTVTMFDKRGVGLSDPAAGVMHAEAFVEDVRVVLGAAGVDRTTVLAAAEASFVAVPLAAFSPEVVDGLVLVNATARILATPDYPEGVPMPVAATYAAEVLPTWGDEPDVRYTAPSRQGDRAFLDWAGEYQRLCASPGVSRRIMQMMGEADVRPLLPAVQAPTVVLHRRGNRFYSVRAGRYLADHIPGARFVEMPGADHLFWVGDTEPVLEAVAELAGAPVPTRTERVLATVVFTDIVGSTEHAARMGDDRWRILLDAHDQALRRAVEAERGEVVKFTGDGALALFATPLGALRAAAAYRDAVAGIGLNVRAGAHCGEVERRGGDVSGLAVHVAARIAAGAGAGEIRASRVIRDLSFGSGVVFEHLGRVHLKGVPGETEVVAVRL